ncbi:MAG: hypothetical protein QME94_07030, partial [Anaerolineae bacterium]|nr:hypothetical protein [Anaerolineae bacterium]
FCLIFQSGRGNAPIALYSDVHYDYIAKEEMSPHRTMWFRRKLYQLNATKRASWPRSFLAHLVRLYGQAMDATDDSGAYLALWQVLEYATCPLRAKVDYERVQERVCCLLRPTDSTLQDALQCLLESRHDLVHEGRFPSGGLGSRHSHEAERVNALRLLVQLALYVVMPLVSKYPQPDELEHYYQYEVARMRLSKAKSALQVRSKTR